MSSLLHSQCIYLLVRPFLSSLLLGKRKRSAQNRGVFLHWGSRVSVACYRPPTCVANKLTPNGILLLILVSTENCDAPKQFGKRSNPQFIENFRMHAQVGLVPISLQGEQKPVTQPSAGIEPATFRLLSGCSTN